MVYAKVQTRIRLWLLESKFFQTAVPLQVPNLSILSEPIQSFEWSKETSQLRFQVDTVKYFSVNLFSQRSIQKEIFDVYQQNFVLSQNPQLKMKMKRPLYGHGRKIFVIFNALGLAECLCNEAQKVSIHIATSRVNFPFEHLLGPLSVSTWERNADAIVLTFQIISKSCFLAVRHSSNLFSTKLLPQTSNLLLFLADIALTMNCAFDGTAHAKPPKISVTISFKERSFHMSSWTKYIFSNLNLFETVSSAKLLSCLMSYSQRPEG